jgi:hypothetical protein
MKFYTILYTMNIQLIRLALIFTIFSCSILIIPQSFAATQIYLNETATVNIKGSAPEDNYTLPVNLSLNDALNLTFEADLNDNGQFEVELTASNKSGYLIKIRIIDEAGGIANDAIQVANCNDPDTLAVFCDAGSCGGNDFVNNLEYNLFYDANLNKINMSVQGNSVGTINICPYVEEVGFINFTRKAGNIDVKNRLLIGLNKNPTLDINIANLTWDEDSSTSFNINTSFSDLNNDALSYTYTSVDNISINIDNTSGLVNLTPDPDFFGIRFVHFIANDGENITLSNNVTLNVTNVNDIPTVENLVLLHLDDLNRTNGSIFTSWDSIDKDLDIISENETRWFLNGLENISLRNFTTLGFGNTSKGENWSFSARIFDGTNFSDWAYSLNITIQNTLQEFSPSLGTIFVERNRVFFFDVNYTDLDNDSISFFDNSTLFEITGEGIINFTPTEVKNITINITLSQNPNVSEIMTLVVNDNLAPIIQDISTVNSGSSTVTINLSLNTDEISECRFSKFNLNYTNMTLMSSTNSTLHHNSEQFSSDDSGTYYVRCNDSYGNIMDFSNSSAFNANVQEPSDGESGSTSSGGGFTFNRACTLEWECGSWSFCDNKIQERVCKLVPVQEFTIKGGCPQETIPENSRPCSDAQEDKATCDDKRQNQGEEGIDCGGPCNQLCESAPLPSVQESEIEITESGIESITGNLIYDLRSNFRLRHGIITSLGLFLILAAGYFRFFHNKNQDLSENEMKKLQEMIKEEYKEIKKD